MNLELFKKELNKLNIELNDNQINQLNKYYELLIEYNEVINLTGITEYEDVLLKHFYDSLTMFKVIDLKNEESLCDIGTGAGFPGLVIKICFPHLKVVLLDSLNKRINFLKKVVKELDLKDIEVIHARAEEYAKKNRNKFDVTTARAVAHLSILLEYSIPMTKVGKYFIALKGNVDKEFDECNDAFNQLNVKTIIRDDFLLPVEYSKRTIIKFQKIKDNIKFPRKYSEIKKKRL